MDARRGWILAGLGVALATAVIVSPFASPEPDGLERVAIDQGFADREQPAPAGGLPFARLFSGYALRGLTDPGIAKAAAGAVGTLTVFGVALGLGRLLRRSDRIDAP